MNRINKISKVLLLKSAKVETVTKDALEKVKNDRTFSFKSTFKGTHQFDGKTVACEIKMQQFPVSEASFKEGKKTIKGYLVAKAFEYEAGSLKDKAVFLSFYTATKTNTARIREVDLAFENKEAIVNPVPRNWYNEVVKDHQIFGDAYSKETEMNGKTYNQETQRVNVGTCALGTIAREASKVENKAYFRTVRIYNIKEDAE